MLMEIGFIILAMCVFFLGVSYGDIKVQLERVQETRHDINIINDQLHRIAQLDVSVQRRLSNLQSNVTDLRREKDLIITKLTDFNTCIREIQEYNINLSKEINKLDETKVSK